MADFYAIACPSIPDTLDGTGESNEDLSLVRARTAKQVQSIVNSSMDLMKASALEKARFNKGNLKGLIERLNQRSVGLFETARPWPSTSQELSDVYFTLRRLSKALDMVNRVVPVRITWKLWRYNKPKSSILDRTTTIRSQIDHVLEDISHMAIVLIDLPPEKPAISKPERLRPDQYYPISSFELSMRGLEIYKHNDKIGQFLAALDIPDYQHRHKDCLSQRLPGSCEWLIRDLDRRKWFTAAKVEDGDDLIWCFGQAGVGKSVVVSAVVGELRKRGRDCAFYYISHATPHLASELAISILAQLPWEDDSLEGLSESLRGAGRRPSVEALEKAVLNEKGRLALGRTSVVIDGWDQRSIPPDQATEFDRLLELISRGAQKMFITSRLPHPASTTPILKQVRYASINLQDNLTDVELFTRTAIKGRKFFGSLLAVPEDIINAIVHASQGIFLWAAIFVDLTLKRLLNPPASVGIEGLLESAVETPINRAAGDSTGLHTPQPASDVAHTGSAEHRFGREEVHRAVVTFIQGQPDHLRQIATTTVAWLAVSRAPLTLNGLCEGLLARTNPRDFQSLEGESYPAHQFPHIQTLVPRMRNTVLQYCQCLIKIDPSTSTILFRHYEIEQAVQRLLESESHHLPEITNIAEVCLRYLLLDVFGKGPCETESKLLEFLSKYQFLNYAAHSWSHQLGSTIDVPTTKLVMQLLRSPKNLALGLQICLYWRIKMSSNEVDWEVLVKKSRTTTPLHIAAHDGLLLPVRQLISHGSLLDAFDEIDQFTPLHDAARQGQLEVVKALVIAGASLLPRDKNNKTPLHHAQMCSKDSKGTVFEFLTESLYEQSLKQDRDPSPTVFDGLEDRASLLSFFMQYCLFLGHENATTSQRTRAYCDAVCCGSIVRILVLLDKENDNRVDADAEDEHGVPALHLAISHHSKSSPVIEVLLNNSATPSIRNSKLYDESALQCAIRHKNSTAVNLLLTHGADMHHINQAGKSALIQAVEMREHDRLQVHPSHVPQLNVQSDGAGNVPIASQERSEVDFLKLLMDRGLQIDQPQASGKSALFDAVQEGDENRAKVLIEAGADVNQLDATGRPILFHAVDKSNLAMIQLFFKYGADVDKTDRDGRTVLFEAVSQGNNDVAELILCSGIDIQAKDKEGRSILHEAAVSEKSDLRTMEMLAFRLWRFHHDLKKLDPPDNKGKTPKEHAKLAGQLQESKYDTFLKQLEEVDWVIVEP